MYLSGTIQHRWNMFYISVYTINTHLAAFRSYIRGSWSWCPTHYSDDLINPVGYTNSTHLTALLSTVEVVKTTHRPSQTFLPALPEDTLSKDTVKVTSVAAWRSLISTHIFTCLSSSLTGKMVWLNPIVAAARSEEE